MSGQPACMTYNRIFGWRSRRFFERERPPELRAIARAQEIRLAWCAGSDVQAHRKIELFGECEVLLGQRVGKAVAGVLKGELAEHTDLAFFCPCADRLERH